MKLSGYAGNDDRNLYFSYFHLDTCILVVVVVCELLLLLLGEGQHY